MDNMLYIIAGLIIILVIGVWILRRNKAQRPPNQAIRPDNLAPSIAPTSHAASTSVSTATLFDDITIAQRFIDQQRYDKAIETLKRGLSQKPNDSALSLKLLNVYALNSDNKAFYDTYNSIITHGDIDTIAQARQLKELIDDDHHVQASTTFDPTAQNKADTVLTDTSPSSAVDITAPVLASSNSSTTNNEMSLDFDYSVSTPTSNNDLAITPATDTDIKGQDSTDNTPSHSFDLTLDDLEATDEIPVRAKDLEIEPAVLLNTENNTNVLDSGVLDSDVLDFAAPQSPDNRVNSEIAVTDELVLDSDNIENSLDIQSIADSAVTHKTDNYNEDDFEIDFDNLLNDADSKDLQSEQVEVRSTDHFVLDFDKSSDLVDQSLTLDIGSKPSVRSDAESIDVDEDFLLFLDEGSNEATENSKAEDTEDFASHSFSSTTDNVLELDTLDSSALADTSDKSPALEIPLTFSDDSDLEALDFNIEPPKQGVEPVNGLTETEATSTNSSPVLPDEIRNPDLSASFADQFAADFEFVDALDSQQITLDLAEQYLQLGEYDSANRLLNEVVAQGNPEQQQQAQALLARSA